MARMQQLLEYLESLPAGSIADGDELASLLADCWSEFDGGNAEGMQPNKLPKRMENIRWEPPVLSFAIERHGGAAFGSSRAELQGWSVNVQSRKATCSEDGHRQLTRMQPRQNVKVIAEEVVRLILNRQEDSGLKWNKDGSVRVRTGDLIPPDRSVVEQTLARRRTRFRQEVERLLTGHGWHKVGTNVYARTPS